MSVSICLYYPIHYFSNLLVRTPKKLDVISSSKKKLRDRLRHLKIAVQWQEKGGSEIQSNKYFKIKDFRYFTLTYVMYNICINLR